MSFTNIVPASVPSLFQSSWPLVPLSALKYNTPFTSVNSVGYPEGIPWLISFSSTVPALVPSLFQSSHPFISVAGKYKTAFTLTKPLLPVPVTTSLTRKVPASVPSLFQSLLFELKYNSAFTLVKFRRLPLPVPGLISFTNTVPASVPSLFHNSLPVIPLLASKDKTVFTLASWERLLPPSPG